MNDVFAGIILASFKKSINYQILQPSIIQTYTKLVSASEIRNINA